MNIHHVICAIVVASGSCGWQASGQTLAQRLASPSGSYSIEATGSLSAFLSVAAAFQLPMGVEWVKVTRTELPLSRKWDASTPGVILEDVTKAYGYEYDITNGVVHVHPGSLYRDAANVLNTRLDSFEVRNEYVSFAAYLLARKVRPIMVPPEATQEGRGFGGSIASGGDETRVSIETRNVTVRDVLDRLCLAAERNVWIVAYPPQTVKTRGGFLKTVPLHTSAQRDDETYAPDWIFLRWGIRPTIGD